MNRIEFIPLIEPATKKDKESEITPSGTFSIMQLNGIYTKKEN